MTAFKASITVPSLAIFSCIMALGSLVEVDTEEPGIAVVESDVLDNLLVVDSEVTANLGVVDSGSLVEVVSEEPGMAVVEREGLENLLVVDPKVIGNLGVVESESLEVEDELIVVFNET